jgi:hypothetical protein
VKKAFFFVAGIAVGLCTSLITAQGAGSIAVLNTSGVYIELLTLVPGQGSGQHSPFREVGIIAEGEVVLSSLAGRDSFRRAGLLVAGLTRTIFAMKAIGRQNLRNCDEAMIEGNVDRRAARFMAAC